MGLSSGWWCWKVFISRVVFLFIMYIAQDDCLAQHSAQKRCVLLHYCDSDNHDAAKLYNVYLLSLGLCVSAGARVREKPWKYEFSLQERGRTAFFVVILHYHYVNHWIPLIITRTRYNVPMDWQWTYWTKWPRVFFRWLLETATLIGNYGAHILFSALHQSNYIKYTRQNLTCLVVYVFLHI